MRYSKTLLVPVILALAAPQAATAGVAVDFYLKKSELSTPAKREILLDRMTKLASRSCKQSSALTSRGAIKSCTEDLRAQFVRAIDHDALTLLAEARGRDIYRTASR